MKPILQNLVEMTGHRDHLRLEVSVLSTLQTLSSIVEVRALELFTDGGVPHVRPRSWVEDGQLVSTDSEAAADPRRETLDKYPALRDCIANHGDSALASPRRGRHVLWLPVWMHDKVNTCLEITQSRSFSAHKLEVLKGVFQVYQNYQSLLDYSERDALTGLFNRKTFDEQFSRHALNGLASGRSGTVTESIAPEEGSLPGEPVQQWLAVVDIDHFKLVNDRFGHLYGDEVLILIANILRSSFRSHDRIFRFGGEEFVVLLRSTTLSTAHRVFNRFRLAVQEYHFPQVGQVTVSLGFVSTNRGSPVEILGQADQALYYAKEHGRNQVCFYDDLVASGQLAAKVANDDVELF
ncbi:MULTISPECIES: GGDEF domain-containing protein [Acidovorax]|uniref:GGDEF domain-containing protein n=1 Tax=Acidovorax TaxID=12916 RepID=UPI0002377B7A|nr:MULTISPECIES: GGDEF domain-containing protein [Acidovorax]KRD18495.1 diguanylate cyclase [Acidovorax sp. Root267]KRD55548.1 diguanylate cyclase [Acidovorax sp. Root275]MBD9391186.1 GGDEF domain-containing protein [Acidovorax sp. ACV01]